MNRRIEVYPSLAIDPPTDSRSSWAALSGVLSWCVDQDRIGGHRGAGAPHWVAAFRVNRRIAWEVAMTDAGGPDPWPSILWRGAWWAQVDTVPPSTHDGADSTHGDLGLRDLLLPGWLRHQPEILSSSGVPIDCTWVPPRDSEEVTELGNLFWSPAVNRRLVTYNPELDVVERFAALADGVEIAALELRDLNVLAPQ